MPGALQAMLSEFKAVTDAEKREVVELGGLHVVGTERHESRRIDNQLRGRSGRQGDPGSTRCARGLRLHLPVCRGTRGRSGGMRSACVCRREGAG